MTFNKDRIINFSNDIVDVHARLKVNCTTVEYTVALAFWINTLYSSTNLWISITQLPEWKSPKITNEIESRERMAYELYSFKWRKCLLAFGRWRTHHNYFSMDFMKNAKFRLEMNLCENCALSWRKNCPVWLIQNNNWKSKQEQFGQFAKYFSVEITKYEFNCRKVAVYIIQSLIKIHILCLIDSNGRCISFEMETFNGG